MERINAICKKARRWVKSVIFGVYIFRYCFSTSVRFGSATVFEMYLNLLKKIHPPKIGTRLIRAPSREWNNQTYRLRDIREWKKLFNLLMMMWCVVADYILPFSILFTPFSNRHYFALHIWTLANYFFCTQLSIFYEQNEKNWICEIC